MLQTLCIPTILANAASLREVTRFFQHPVAMRGGGVMLVAGLSLVAFWIAMTYWEKHRQQTEALKLTPTALFHGLCAIHELNREQIHLLQSCTQAPHELPTLFVDPVFLETFAKTHPTQTAGALKLRDLLFGHSGSRAGRI